jgi:hypothetical protein
MKVILKAYEIPSGKTITKPTGTKEYTLLREIKLWPQKHVEPHPDVKAKDGCVFLLDDRGNIDIYPPDTLFAWVVDRDDLHGYLHELEMGPQK